MSGFHALQPVSEAATDTGEDRVHPEGFLEEERASFDAELPEVNGDAFRFLVRQVMELGGERTEATPEEDFMDHGGGGSGVGVSS